jgi:hypothetical protein
MRQPPVEVLDHRSAGSHECFQNELPASYGDENEKRYGGDYRDEDGDDERLMPPVK